MNMTNACRFVYCADYDKNQSGVTTNIDYTVNIHSILKWESYDHHDHRNI